jgi:hypothetical protein
MQNWINKVPVARSFALRSLLSASLVPFVFCGCKSCPPPAAQSFIPARPGAHVVTIDPRKPWNPTRFQLQAGRTYHFEAAAEKDAAGHDYQDSTIPCTPNGPCGFKGWLFDKVVRDARLHINPFHWFGPGKIKRVRVLKDRDGHRATFLTVIGAVGTNDARENVIGSGRDVTAHASGELVVFCNDWPGGKGASGDARFADSITYMNNRGQIRLSIEPR